MKQTSSQDRILRKFVNRQFGEPSQISEISVKIVKMLSKQAKRKIFGLKLKISIQLNFDQTNFALRPSVYRNHSVYNILYLSAVIREYAAFFCGVFEAITCNVNFGSNYFEDVL